MATGVSSVLRGHPWCAPIRSTNVKKMIKDIVVKLMEEAAEEPEHKSWCDNALATNEQTRKEKTASVEVLLAEIDELSKRVVDEAPTPGENLMDTDSAEISVQKTVFVKE